MRTDTRASAAKSPMLNTAPAWGLTPCESQAVRPRAPGPLVTVGGGEPRPRGYGMNALLNSLAEAELLLIRETERDQLADLDEDALVELHTRVRRARNKYVKLYRRE